MKIIDRRNFFSTVCIIFTLLLFCKIILEYIIQDVFGNYQENLVVMFFLSLVATFVLSQHYRFQKYPLLVVILGQYLLLIAVVMLMTRVSGCFQTLHENAYRDMFLSFSIPYIIGVIIYYAALFREIKYANQTLQTIKALKEKSADKVTEETKVQEENEK